MDNLSQEEINAALEQAGIKPGMGMVTLNDNNTVSVRPLPTEDRGALEVLGRRFAGRLPEAAGAATFMGLGSGAIAVGATGGAAIGTATGPLAPVLGPVGGLVGGMLPAIALGGTGAQIGKAIDDNTFHIREKMLGNPAQQARDTGAHPWASTAGDFLGEMASFGPPSRALATGVAKLGTAARWARGAMNFSKDEAQALTSHGANALLGAGQDAAAQYSQNGEIDPTEVLKAGATGALLGNPGGTLKGLRGLRAKPPVIAPSVQSPSAPPAPELSSSADRPWQDRASAGQDLTVAEWNKNVDKDRVAGTLAPKMSAAIATGTSDRVKIAKQAFEAKKEMTVAEGESVRQRILAELSAREQTMDPKDVEVARTKIANMPPKELAQFKGDIEAYDKTQADERTAQAAAPTTADLEQSTIRKNVQNWKRPEIPVEQAPAPVAPSTADPIRDNMANELQQAFAQNQITGAPLTPRPQATRFSRPVEGADKSLPQTGPRTEAETIQDYLERRRVKYQPVPKSEAVDAPTPEPAGVLVESLRLAADPAAGKKAAFIPNGSPRPAVPQGMVSLAHPKGEFIYNPQKMTAQEAAAAISGDQLDGQALGLGQSTKPTTPTDHSVVTDSNGQPAVMTEVVSGPEDIARATVAQQAAAPGSTQRVVPTEEVLKGREAGLASPLPAAAPRPPLDPAAARPASSPSPASPLAVTTPLPATPESIAAGRQALDRRGFKYSETDAPINEGKAAGAFDPVTGEITVSRPQAQDTTYHHEGMHGQLQSLMLSKNPRERQFAIDLIAAHGEEPLAELGARASIAGNQENRLLRLVKDNWNWLRTTKLGGGDMTPERAARLLAESFDHDAPGAVPTGAGGVKNQPSQHDTPEFQNWFANSKVVDAEGKPLVVYHGTQNDFNTFKSGTEGTYGKGIYAAGEADRAAAYATNGADHPKAGTKLIPIYASLKNPIVVEHGGMSPVKVLEHLGYSPEKASSIFERALEDTGGLVGQVSTRAQKMGYDGIIAMKDGKPFEVVAFHPNQIKSATGNSGEFSPANNDIRYQLVTTNHEGVPGSVFAKADALYPGMAERLGAYEGTKAKHYGIANTAIDALRGKQYDAVRDSIMAKMQDAHAKGTQPNLTPDEVPVYNRLTKFMHDTADVTTAGGLPVNKVPNYFPHMLAGEEARAYERDSTKYLADKTKRYVDWNLNEYGPARGATPEQVAEHFAAMMEGVRRAPSSLGADFGALHKEARQFGLPPEMRDQSALNVIHRYGQRFAIDLAKKQEFLDHPDFANAIGLGDKPLPMAGDQAMIDARLHVNNALGNQVKDPHMREAGEIMNAGRQLIHSMVMQTKTALNNHIGSLPMHMVHWKKPEHFVNFLTDTLTPMFEWKAQREKAIAMSLVKPGVDPTGNVSDMAGLMTQNLKKAANKLRTVSLGEFAEVSSRVRNYTYGESRARTDLLLAQKGDKTAQDFLDKFGAGVDTNQPFEEQVARVSTNYADSIEGKYSGASLPASMVNGSVISHVGRINRYPMEQMARAYQYTIHPIQKNGDYAPLLLYLFGSALSTAALTKVSKEIWGGVSGLISEDEAKAAGANPQYETLLNIMELAGTGNVYGMAGNAVGAVAKTLRGRPQAVFGDPSINYVMSAYKNIGAGVDAIKRGEPVVPTLLEVAKRNTLDQMQMTRGLFEDKEIKGDKQLKAKQAYLTDRKTSSATKMLGGLLTGSTFNYQVPEISPSRDKAIAGDRQAFLAQPPATRRRLDNYPGGYESTADQVNLETWMAAAHPERLADYIHRRQAFKDTVHGKAQGGQR